MEDNKMVVLKFRDMKARKSFETDDYEIVMKGKRKFAVAIAPSGIKAFRIVGKNFVK